MIYIGADHRGYSLKEKIKTWLESQQIKYEDIGAFKINPEDDYPLYAAAVAKMVAQGPEQHKGLVICGSGVGVSIVANKFRGVRCGLISSPEMARAATNDDAMNVVALAADFTNDDMAEKIVSVWLTTTFSNDTTRYVRRVKEIAEIENQLMK